MKTLDYHTAKTYLENLYQEFRQRVSVRTSKETTIATPVASVPAQPPHRADPSASGDSGSLISIHIG